MRYTTERFKDLSIKEFTKAAEKYEWHKAWVYKICRKDYPDIFAEIKREEFKDLLDVWCWTGSVLSLLSEEFPNKHYVGLDLTPRMIEVAKSKKLKNVEFIVWDAENLPFKDNSFDVVICSQSFHHYPNPQKFFDWVYKILRPWGRFILRDMSWWILLSWFINNIELPFLNIIWFWDVRTYTKNDIYNLCKKSWLKLEIFKYKLWFRLHAVIRK